MSGSHRVGFVLLLLGSGRSGAPALDDGLSRVRGWRSGDAKGFADRAGSCRLRHPQAKARRTALCRTMGDTAMVYLCSPFKLAGPNRRIRLGSDDALRKARTRKTELQLIPTGQNLSQPASGATVHRRCIAKGVARVCLATKDEMRSAVTSVPFPIRCALRGRLRDQAAESTP